MGDDFGYVHAFERYIKINFKEEDILVCISSSGNSENIVKAANCVLNKGGNVVSFTGFDENNKISKISTMNFWVDSKIYNIVESIHNLWLAMICDVLTNLMKDSVGTHGIIL